MICSRCQKADQDHRPLKRGGFHSHCRACERSTASATRAAKRELVEVDIPVDDLNTDKHIEAARARIDSDYDQLRPEDFDVAVGNDGKIDKAAAKEKRQEYSKAMGEFAQALRETGGDVGEMPAYLGTYIGRLSEQERRFRNRRLARSVSIAAANEALHRSELKILADTHFRDKITPTGYALKTPKNHERTVVVHFSDLHIGAEMRRRDHTNPFGAIEEARRLEYILHYLLNRELQYRDQTRLLVLLNGDLIDGDLEHDKRDGAPLREQKAAFWHYFRIILGLLSQNYPTVDVECRPGNHGRDKLRHPGRATSSKWDGHEWEMLYILSQMCSSLHNVHFNLPMGSAALVQLYDKRLLVFHGDTEPKIFGPDHVNQNRAEMQKHMVLKTFGETFDVATWGHQHVARNIPGTPHIIINPALIPPNGYALAEGYVGEVCGVSIWEAVPGHPVGNYLCLQVGPQHDRDTALGKLVTPFRFDPESAQPQRLAL